VHNVQLVGMTIGEAMGVARWEVIGALATIYHDPSVLVTAPEILIFGYIALYS